MTSLLRPVVATLLCGMIVFGHAPAWLHVGSCDGHGHAERIAASTDSASACPHGCQHHPTSAKTTPETSETNHSGDDHQHDSDTCVLCQSLVVPTGVTWGHSVSVPSVYLSLPIFVASDLLPPATLLCVPRPRGPPVTA